MLDESDASHLRKSLRMRDGDALSMSDGKGSWSLGCLGSNGGLEPTGDVFFVAPPTSSTVAFSLVKGSKPELVIQKLTELGISRIVILEADRSVVKWDEAKRHKAQNRWSRIIREAAMQSHRVRLPELDGPMLALDWLSRPDVTVADVAGVRAVWSGSSIAIGPEGGWSDREINACRTRTVNLFDTVLRAETAAIAAASLLSASIRSL